MENNKLKKQKIKKCSIKGCNKPATNKIKNIVILNNDNKIRESYIYVCKKHYRNGKIKEILSLKGTKESVYLAFYKNGDIDFFIDDQRKKRFAGIGLSIKDIKWLIYFILKNEANLYEKR